MDYKIRNTAQQGLLNALSPIRHLLDDPLIQEIEINGPDDVWVERQGVQEQASVTITRVQIESAIQILARLDNKDARAGTRDGIIDARIEGFRVAAALQPTSVRGPSMCIRKHNPLHLAVDDYIKAGALTEEWGRWLCDAVRKQKNILVVGGTSSGKTTFVNALIGEIPDSQRVLTIEDTPELRVKVPNWVSLESNVQENITTRDLVKLALRYRPDRIIIGEVRGAEAFDLLDAANTGHDGVLATLHANSAMEGLIRFETLILGAGINWPHRAICTQIARTFDAVVFMARRNGKRRMEQLIELTDYDGTEEKYRFNTLFSITED